MLNNEGAVITQNSGHPFTFRNYRHFWTARLFSMLAQNCVSVILGWQAYEVARRTMSLEGAAAQLGIIGLIQFLPIATLSLHAGLVADRQDRRFIVGICLAIQAFVSVALAMLTATGQITLGSIFAIAAVQGMARAFYLPAMNALGPNCVPKAVLPRAVALSTLSGRFGAILGPVLGGALFTLTPALPYQAAVGMLLVSMLLVLTISNIERPRMATRRSPFHEIADGLRYVRQSRVLLGAISLDMVAVLVGGATALLPVFAREVLQVDADGLGLLRAAPALGAIATGLWCSRYPIDRRVGKKMLVSVGIFGLATVCFGLARTMPAALVSLFAIGASDMVSVMVRQSLIQIRTPDEMRGRVGAMSALFISTSNELGEAESGFAAALFGPVAAVVGGGIGAVIIALAWVRLFPDLAKANRLSSPEGE
ncbi:MFS transporter [Novosphingobium sp. AAP83]|uniref:MFS transporter n=1 Tax=Novosphingobium sp. AAP83 TaxID=1523425 RepID=UPI0006B8D28B|nr:MFS transporter [Novosphingobium sp. AAP83]KPF88587.1 MFS transporter [Novosphingobium sp. AAP83]